MVQSLDKGTKGPQHTSARPWVQTLDMENSSWVSAQGTGSLPFPDGQEVQVQNLPELHTGCVIPLLRVGTQ